MPKVSEQYLLERREHILEAARRCFVRKGFHQSSMQDLFTEAGLSAGAVYRYFRSKDEVVIAVVEQTIGDVIETISTVSGGDPHSSLGEALAAAVELIADRDDADGLCRLAVEVWSEVARNERLGEQFGAMLQRSRTRIAQVVRTQQRAGALPADVGAAALASVVTTVLPGYILQRALVGPAAVRQVPAGLRAMWPSATARPCG